MNVANILNAFHYLYVIYDTDEESLCSEQCSWRPQTPGQGRYTYLGLKKKKIRSFHIVPQYISLWIVLCDDAD